MPVLTAAQQRLAAPELPLVLLAATGHPERQVRASFLHRLDEAIDDMEPCYPTPPRSRRELRAFFFKQDRRRKGGVRLGLVLRELAVRLALLTFTKPCDDRQCRLLLGDDRAEKAGYIVDADLSALDLRRSSLTRHRIKRRAVDSRFLPAQFLRRLGEIRRGDCPIQAVCRVEKKLVLEFRGAIPWKPALRSGRATHSPFPGWECEQENHLLRLWPDSPEAVVRLTAGMAAGKTLCFQPPRGHHGGAILVRLHDFDGDEAKLRVKVTPVQEPWLFRIPLPPLQLTPEDRLTLVRWAYPVPHWLSPEFTENLI